MASGGETATAAGGEEAGAGDALFMPTSFVRKGSPLKDMGWASWKADQGLD